MADKHDKIWAIYARVSTEEQARAEYSSIDSQIERCQAYIHASEPNAETRIYSDEGASGKNLKRPAMRDLLADIAKGKICAVIVYKIDRLTRSPRDFYALAEKFDEHDVAFISTSQKFDTSTPIGRLMRGMLLEFAQFEREMIADRVRDKCRQKAEKGLWNGGHIPPGYRRDPNRTSYLIINEKEALIVRRIFEMYIGGMSGQEIAQRLNSEGHRSKGSLWHKKNVLHLLANPVYIGKRKYHDEIFDGVHKPIISQSTWDTAQRELRKNRHTVKRRVRRKREYIFLLERIVRCGLCGSMMVPTYSTGRSRRHYYYRCGSENNNSGCKGQSINAEVLDKAIMQNALDLITVEGIADSALKAVRRQESVRRENIETEISKLRKELSPIEKSLAQLVAAVESGADVRPLVSRMKDLDGQKIAIENRIAELKREKESVGDDVIEADFRAYLKSIRDVIQSLPPHEAKPLIAMFIKSITINPDTIEMVIFDHSKSGAIKKLTHKKTQSAKNGALSGNSWWA